MKVLFLTSDLARTGAGKQLTLLTAGLPRDRFTLQVAVLGRDGPWGQTLRQNGVEVVVCGWTRLLDAPAFLGLRRLVRTVQPDIIHAFGLPAMRVALPIRGRGRVAVSKPLPPRERGPRINGWDRWLLGRADQVVATGAFEAQLYRTLGAPAQRIRVIPPGVASADRSAAIPTEIWASLNLPANARVLMCVGALTAPKGYWYAIWAFDILKYLYDDLHLVLIGQGPERQRLEKFARDIQTTGRVHFAGEQADASAWLSRAEVVWIPSLAETGINVALEAMAVGRPVVASRLPGLAEIVVEGETGFLVPPGDKVALARQTRLLLDDADSRQRLGEAGRRRVQHQFAVADLVQEHARLYEALMGSYTHRGES